MDFRVGDYVSAPGLIPPLKLGKIIESHGSICPHHEIMEIQDNGEVGPRLLKLYEPNLTLVARLKDNITSSFTC